MIRTVKVDGLLRYCINNKISLSSPPIRSGRRYSSAFNFCNYLQPCGNSLIRQMADKASKHRQGLLNGAKVDTSKHIIRTTTNASDLAASGEAFIVNHDLDGERFYIDIPGVGTADIDYERRDQLLIFKHTTVPSELGGRGLGKILAKVRRYSNTSI